VVATRFTEAVIISGMQKKAGIKYVGPIKLNFLRGYNENCN
jgi:hypothetical protein